MLLPRFIIPGLASLLGSLFHTSSVTIGTTPRQTLTSFGASGAWWPNDLQFFPTSVQSQLGDLLFSQDGLWLSSYRYNMGGEGGNDARNVTTQGKQVESFLQTDGTYDFSRDAAGVSFLKIAQQYAVPYITFFVNAAPSHIADTDSACGWYLTSDKTPAFAAYIKTVLTYWLNQGINVKYISPMNEPDNIREACDQEGMGVLPFDRAATFQAIRQALNSNPVTTPINIIGDETSQITTQAILEYPLWLAAAEPYLSNIAVHNYDYPSDESLSLYYAYIQDLFSRPPPVKFTETCCATNSGTGSSVFGAQYDPTMTNALIVARYVWQFLTIVNAESFDWWTAVTDLACSPTITPGCQSTIHPNAGYNSGLIYIDPAYNTTHDYTLYLTKRFYALKHFSYFHRPGSVRYDVSLPSLPAGVEALATKLGPTWNVLFLNNQTTVQAITLNTPGTLLSITETSPVNDFAGVNLPATSQGTLQLNLPAHSMWTLQFASS